MSKSQKFPVAHGAQLRFPLLALLLTIFSYFGAGQLYFSIAQEMPPVSLIWLPAGIAIAAILRFGKFGAGGVFAGALWLNLSLHYSLMTAAVFSVGSTASALLCCWLLQRRNFDFQFSHRHDVIGFVLSVCIASTLSSCIGIFWLSLAGLQTPSLLTWFTWWAGDTVGALLIGPVLLSMSDKTSACFRASGKEILVFSVLLTTALWLIFLSPYNLHLTFITACLMIWSAMRFDIGIAATINLLACLFAAGTTAHQLGPFVHSGQTGLFTLWGYISIMSLITLFTTALQSENSHANRKISEAYQRINKVASRLPGLILQYRIRPDRSSCIPYVSEAIFQMFEVHHDAVRDDASLLFKRIDARDIEQGKIKIEEAIRQLSAWQSEFRLYRLDGSMRWLFIDGLPEPESDGSILWHCFVTDITDRKQAEIDMRIAACTFESQEGICVADADWKILKLNHAFTRITGYTTEEFIGRRPPMFTNKEQDAAFFQAIQSALDQHHYWHGELWSLHKNGKVCPLMTTLTAILDDHGMLTNYVASFTDISRDKGYEAEIRNLAFYDSLTQLPNRRLLMDRLEHLISISKRNHTHSAILFIDLDNFKTLNDTRGHDAGDLLLIETAKRLQSCVRDSDTVARLGGDEFVVVLEELSEARDDALRQTDRIADKIRQALCEPYLIADFEHHGSCSIGVCLFQDGDITVKDLFKRADTAMYEAKTAGRNAVRFFDPAMQAILIVRMLLESNLRVAVTQKQFQLYYQVQVNSEGKLLGAEALLRWIHPDRGFISPADFIPLAEETGLILPIGDWVLETACAQIKQWESDPSTAELSLAVNVSAKQFQQANFVDIVSEKVARYGINPNHLKIELTESTVLDNVDATTEKMHQLRKIGIAFSMDDFGTGYSSLAYLQRLPLNQLKIDQSFVRDLSEDENDATIVRAIISLGLNLGLNVIAEGVETKAQRAFLIAHNCNAFQGYLFSKPLPLDAFITLVKQPASNDAA